MNKLKFVCPDSLSGRVDKILAFSFPDVSRSLIKKAIEDRRVIKVDGSLLNPKSKISSGDELWVDLSRPITEPLEPYDFPLDILFEDESILVINKISGMVTHPGDGTGGDTLVHALMHHISTPCPVGAPNRPGIVHRLDKETSGVIVIAKTEKAYHELIRQFSAREVKKEYLALVRGSLSLDSGEFMGSIRRHPKLRFKMCVSEDGKPAITRWLVIRRFSKDYTLVSCRILTGRTHQIRVHFSTDGHSLVGDETYGKVKNKKKEEFSSRLMLHSHTLGFSHPLTKRKVEYIAPIPEDFGEVIDYLERTYSD